MNTIADFNRDICVIQRQLKRWEVVTRSQHIPLMWKRHINQLPLFRLFLCQNGNLKLVPKKSLFPLCSQIYVLYFIGCNKINV